MNFRNNSDSVLQLRANGSEVICRVDTARRRRTGVRNRDAHTEIQAAQLLELFDRLDFANRCIRDFAQRRDSIRVNTHVPPQRLRPVTIA
jgi:hypothetical protein